MTCKIFNYSTIKVLSVMEQSTGHEFYLQELADKTGLSKTTLIPLMRSLTEACLVDKQQESVTETTNRGPRDYYTLTPNCVSTVRVQDPSE